MTERRAEWLVVCAVLVSFGFVVPFLDYRALAALSHDDAFYYLQIARNVVAGHGFSFDGIHATNGFHPLWMLTLLPVFAVFPGDVLPLRVVPLIETAFLAGAALLLYRTLRPRLGTWAAVLAPLLMITLPGSQRILRAGMETSVFLLCLLVVWRRFLQIRDDPLASNRDWFLLGLWCSATFLARLEGLLVLPVIALLAARRLRTVPRLVALSTGPVVTLASYLWWNQAMFGVWLPISGQVKSHLANSVAVAGRLGALMEVPWVGRHVFLRFWGVPELRTLEWVPMLLYVIGILGLVVLAWYHRRTLRDSVRRSGLSMLLLTAALITLADLLTIQALPPWYQSPILLVTAIWIASLVRPFPRLLVGVLAFSVLMAAGRAPLNLFRFRDSTRFYASQRIRAAQWIRDELPEGARIGSWNAGMLGYFSHRAVINLDGLVNDVEYFEQVIQRHRLQQYLAAKGIGWIADQSAGHESQLRGYLARTGSEHLTPRFLLTVVFRNEEGSSPGPGYAVWAYDANGP